MGSWDRSLFSTTPEELEIEEAVRAIERILGNPLIAGSTRVSLSMALQALRDDRK